MSAADPSWKVGSVWEPTGGQVPATAYSPHNYPLTCCQKENTPLSRPVTSYQKETTQLSTNILSKIARIARAALHKLPRKSSLYVSFVFPVCPAHDHPHHSGAGIK